MAVIAKEIIVDISTEICFNNFLDAELYEVLVKCKGRLDGLEKVNEATRFRIVVSSRYFNNLVDKDEKILCLYNGSPAFICFKQKKRDIKTWFKHVAVFP